VLAALAVGVLSLHADKRPAPLAVALNPMSFKKVRRSIVGMNIPHLGIIFISVR
jgi:hypothetical protein